MRILYDNEALNATITGSPENPSYLFSDAFNDYRLARKGRSVGCGEVTVLHTFTTATDVDYVFIIGHNITASATVTIQGNDTNVWTAPAVEETMLIVGDGLYYEFSTTESYQYWRIVVNDATNPDGYVEISTTYLGGFLELAKMEPGVKLPQKTNAIVTETEGMQVFGSIKKKYIEARVSFPLIDDDTKTLVEAFFNSNDIVIPFICIIWEDDLDTEVPFYARLLKPPNWEKKKTVNTILYWEMDLQIRQTF